MPAAKRLADEHLMGNWGQVQILTRRFEEAWQKGTPPLLDDYLSGQGEQHLVLLGELVLTDLEYRWKAGEAIRVETYLQRYPELAADAGMALRVIRAELKLRQRQEPNVTAAEYQQRFPEFAALLDHNVTGEFAPAALISQRLTTRLDAPQVSETGGAVLHPFTLAHGATLAGYQILDELGRGGMGVVYRAYDGKRGIPVALKTLPQLTPEALYHFKKEFRALAGVTHPNLVNLYELIAEGPRWFFAMELVEGQDFLSYVRGGLKTRSEQTQDFQESVPGDDQTVSGPLPIASEPANEERLREALKQLACGVEAIHQAGRLHRDIKPSNVLVTQAGRVVILDFGLAAELDPTGLHEIEEQGITGTVAYMSPEQAAGLPLSAASDWYSVGTMLYEALSGLRPFRGKAAAVLRNKQTEMPPAPSELRADVSQDLNSLCVALLHRQAEQRPGFQEVQRCLGSGRAVPELGVSPGALAAIGLPFVGRERHLRLLSEAYRTMQDRQTVVVGVQGRSGVGKSALVQRFLEEIAATEEAVILTGRCYEHESVPYKAVDAAMDALTRYLRRLPPEEAAALIPPGVSHLARVFPVLRSVPAVAQASDSSAAITDPHELRLRAFSALRVLLARLGKRRPLVLAIDDLQWGDVDSAALFAELLRPPDPPVLLFVGSFRSEDLATSPFLRAFLSSPTTPVGPFTQHQLVVEPLTATETRALGLRLLERDDPEAQALVDLVVRESGGNPFFISELVRHLQSRVGPTDFSQQRPTLSLDQVLWERITRLPDEARHLLEVAAVHGRPLTQTEAWSASCLQTDERPVLAMLCSGRLLRSSGASARDEIETYHDKVRETVLAHLEQPTRAKHHGSLARTLEAGGARGTRGAGCPLPRRGRTGARQPLLRRRGCSGGGRPGF
jgi:hypothetical protein